MKEATILTQLNAHGRTKFINLTLDKNTLSRKWGLLDGAEQETSHTYGVINAGKKNELNPTQAARADYERIIKRKTKEGYVVAEGWVSCVGGVDTELTFETIPTEFCCSKPIAKLNEAKVNKALVKGRVKFQVKYNGACHYILCTPEGKIKLFTRRMDDHTAKYPSIVNALSVDPQIAPGSIFIGELCVDPILDMPHMDAFKRVCEISRVDTLEGKLKEDQTEALARQEETPVRLAIFGVLYYDGEEVASKYTIGEMHTKFLSRLPKVESICPYFRPEVLLADSVEDIKRYLKVNASISEGAIAWMLDEKMEVSYNGKPKRRAAFKVKLPKEDDVIAYGYEEGKGDHQGKIGSLLIGKLSTVTNEMVPLGKVGSGLTDEDCEIANWEFPQVIEIIYNERFPTGKYQFPRFSKKHEDKQPNECRTDRS